MIMRSFGLGDDDDSDDGDDVDAVVDGVYLYLFLTDSLHRATPSFEYAGPTLVACLGVLVMILSQACKLRRWGPGVY